MFGKGRLTGLVWPFPTAPREKPDAPKSCAAGTMSIGLGATGTGIGLAFTKSGSGSLPLPRPVNEVKSPSFITTPCERGCAVPAPDIAADTHKISEAQIKLTEAVIRSAKAQFELLGCFFIIFPFVVVDGFAVSS